MPNDPSVSTLQRAAGGDLSFLASSLSLGSAKFPFKVDQFPEDALRHFAGFRPLTPSAESKYPAAAQLD